MNFTRSRFSAAGKTTATLLGSASLLTMAGMLPAFGQNAGQVQEDILVTGSLIHGAAAVGVPVTNLSLQDYQTRGALTTSELFAAVPAAQLDYPQGTSSKRSDQRANFRGLGSNSATRSLLLVDGMRTTEQGSGNDQQDPSIVPQLAIERLDILVDGAGATYGSDAISAVINEVLKRGYDGATTRIQVAKNDLNSWKFAVSQNWGRTWDGGDVSLTYAYYNETPAKGTPHSNTTVNFAPWGFDDRTAYTTTYTGVASGGQAKFSKTWPGNPATVNTSQFGTNCTNCYTIPYGAGTDWQPGPFITDPLQIGPAGNTLSPAANCGTSGQPACGVNPLGVAGYGTALFTNGRSGVTHEFDLFNTGWFQAEEQSDQAVLTTDQRLTPHIWAFVDAYFYHRSSQFQGQDGGQTVVVPTVNPYYPVGAPANLTVAYNFSLERQNATSEEESAGRYAFGLNFKDLPFGWNGRMYAAYTNYSAGGGGNIYAKNKQALSAALGWTIGTTGTVGSSPGSISWAKPANVPYLNVFCDPQAHQCNSDATWDFITAHDSLGNVVQNVQEKGINLDGPIFDLPAGTLRAAVGTSYWTQHTHYGSFALNGTTYQYQVGRDIRSRSVWAYYTELSIPVFSEMNAFPLFQKLDLAMSYRHDQYTDVHGTTNPKIAFNWTPFDAGWGFQVKGGWGTSFRAPGFGETSTVVNAGISAYNIPAGFPDFGPNSGTTANQVLSVGSNTACVAGGHPVVGSGAYKVNPFCSTVGYGPYTNYSKPIGLEIEGGAIQAAPLYASASGGPNLLASAGNGGTPLFVGPEKATNWSIGFDFAPTDFLKGLDIQATYYVLRISDFLVNFQTPNSGNFNDAQGGFHFITSGDEGGTTNFLAITQMLMGSPYTSLGPNYYTNILWINDGTSQNKGVVKLMGVDWQASYDWDMGDLGAWNAGITGTTYLHKWVTTNPGVSTPEDQYNTNHWQSVNSPDIDKGSTAPKMRYNARVGWSDGPWNATLFMNYISHYNSSQNPPPNVNCGATNGCTINNYDAINPSWYTFDLSLGYNTGDDPVNDYLKNINFQVNVQNIMARLPPFQYRVGTGGGNPTAFDLLKPNYGRTIGLTITKQW